MAGLLAWAADVVAGGGGEVSDAEKDDASLLPIFTPEQLAYIQELDQKAASLNRSIQDLRLRLPPPDISQRLPDLHARSVASNNALSLQLNAHSATKQEAQLREERLQEENIEYQNSILNCQIKIEERVKEADLLRSKLKEVDEVAESLKRELLGAREDSELQESGRSLNDSGSASKAQEEEKASKLALLENKKKEVVSMEKVVQELEKRWQQVQESALKQPTPAQREKALDKQLHSLIEQLAMKQSQAEGLIDEIHHLELELEKSSGTWKRIENRNSDTIITRNRFARSSSYTEYPSDYDEHKLPVHMARRNYTMGRMALLRSAFVLYILLLHLLVFIKIAF